MGWRANLKRNWLYMLTGLLISVFLWIAVSADTVDEQTLPADLLIINTDRRYVLTSRDPPTDEVSVVFTGRAGDLALLSVSRPQIVLAIDQVDSLDWDIGLGPTLVTGRGGRELSDVRALSVRPNRIHLHFEPRAQRIVRVVPRVELSVSEGFAVADSVRTEPGAVAVTGPRAAVEQVDSVMTVEVVRDRLRESLSVEAPLELSALGEFVELSSLSVRVSVPVEPRVERVFNDVPISLIGVDPAGFQIEPPVVEVRVSGPRTAVRAVRPEGLAPRVEFGGPADLGAALRVTLRAPGPFLSVSVAPDSVVVVEQGDDLELEER